MKLEELNAKTFQEKIDYLHDLEAYLGEDIPVHLLFHGIEVEVQLVEEMYMGAEWDIMNDDGEAEGLIVGKYDFKFFTANAEVEME